MTAAHIIRRARRQAAATKGLERATAALRGLGTGFTPPDQARAVAARYVRAALGGPAVPIDDATLAFLAGPKAAAMPIEDLDFWLCQYLHEAAAKEAAAVAINTARGR